MKWAILLTKNKDMNLKASSILSLIKRKKLIMIFFLLNAFCSSTFAQTNMVVSTTLTSSQLVNNVLLGGGVTASNITPIGTATHRGSFSGGFAMSPGLPFLLDQGIILTSGLVSSIPVANTTGTKSDNNSQSGDADLNAILGSNATTNASVLEFDFVPSSDSIMFNYVFGSDEYPEFACGSFNDVFAFLLTGPNPAGGNYTKKNLAVIPGTSTYVGVNTINPGIAGSSGSSGNCTAIDPNWASYNVYYNDNPKNTATIRIQPDGYTDVFTAAAKVVAGATYHIKLAIADNGGFGGDTGYDSYVFIQAKSFSSPAMTTTTTATASTICNGGSTYVKVNLTNGTAPFTYAWSNGTTHTSSAIADSVLVSPTSTTTYTVTITDSKIPTPYTANGTVTVTVASPALSVTSQTNVNCFGGTTGAINITPSGGITPYTFNWGSGVTTEDRSGIGAGVYTVTVLDGNLCPVTSTVTITQPASALSVSVASQTNVNCFGGTTGAINITASGGTSPYSYNWGSSVTLEDRIGLSAGIYTVTVLDNKLCPTTSTVTITQPTSALSVTVTSQSNVDCFGETDGFIDVTASGGTSPYGYNWGSGITLEDLTGVGTGVYTVTVTDNKLCTTTSTVSISQPASALLLSVSSQTNVSCFGGIDGAINITALGGTSPYSYNWGSGITSEDLTGLGLGVYSLTVTDAKLCTSISTVTITQPAAALAISVANQTNINCFGETDGAIDLSATGGTLPYSYNWGSGITSEDLTDLGAGVYEVTLTDAKSCAITSIVTISQPVAALTLAPISFNSTCGNSDGEVSVIPSGGTGIYSYLWIGYSDSTSASMSGLSAGSYTVSVSDQNNCSDQLTMNISDQEAPVVTIVNTAHVSCHGLANGLIETSSVGGTGTITYNWSNGENQNNINSLSGGIYSLSVTDSNNCLATISFEILEPDTLHATLTPVSVSCNSLLDGSVFLSVSGGTTGYTYDWSNGSTIEDLTDLAANTYYVTVTDTHNCKYIDSVVVAEPEILTSSITSGNVNCNGNANGFANLLVEGGNGNNQYEWSNGSLNEDLNNISGGNYIVTITDSKGCIKLDSVNIFEPEALIVDVNVVNAKCYGSMEGAISLSTTGGNGGNVYSWLTGQVSQNLDNLLAGTYQVSVIDLNGCAIVISAEVLQPTELELVVNTQNIDCFGNSTASIELLASGGTVSYSYNWSHNSFFHSNIASNLPAGVYNVEVEDQNKCRKSQTITITEPQELVPTLSTVDILCNGQNTGQIYMAIAGGTIPYSFTWSNGETSENLQNLITGNYSVTVTDLMSCVSIKNATITESEKLLSTPQSINSTCPGSSDGQITLSVNGGVSPYSYEWSNQNTTNELMSISNGNYMVTITDFNNCKITNTVEVKYLDEYCINIPTAFSPNGDGVNDNWEIEHISLYKEISIEIFNRWGQLIFYYSGSGAGYANVDNQWNGTFDGKELPLSSYVFILDLKNNTAVNKGIVTIIK